MKLQWKNFSLDFSKKTCIMGILNVTPDSFSDGGRYLDPGKAFEQACRLVQEGADIIDIGGESTRPGSEPVSADVEIKRVIPVIKAVAKKINIPISIDTCKAEVARHALDVGASMINDISGLRFDREMPRVAAQFKSPVIIMHIKGRPKDMQQNPVYGSLIPEIIGSLRDSIRLAVQKGVQEEMIIIDPGIGFGKTFEHNLEIIKNLHQFSIFKRPIAIGVSRKAFIGKILGDAPPTDRLEGTAAAVSISIFNGANIVRVHDVKEMARVAKTADAIRSGAIRI
ncbi:MAG: dihydropteroate synthase [Nitrospirae bacterium]|nr:dihydropteroate synthase [Nitrospirota bacterium]